MTALQRESAAVTAECDRENDRTLKEHEEYTLRMRETSQRIERLQEQIWAGNLSSDEMAQYEAVKKELGEKRPFSKISLSQFNWNKSRLRIKPMR